MAYPNVPAPYGLKPVNLVGGQLFAGSTRNLPIPYGYSTNIFLGDFVQLTRGFVNRLGVTSGSATTFPIGIFLGCSFTDPVTKQKRFSQYWPASTLAGDAVAIVADDPDTVFKAVVCSSGVVLSSASSAIVGQNVALLDNGSIAASLATGDSFNAVAGPSATPATTSTLPARIVGLVAETSYALAFSGSSSSSTTLTLGVATATSGGTLPLTGCEVGYLAANGQYIGTGSFVSGAIANNVTSLTLNQQPIILGSSANIPASSTVVLTTYQEVLLKLNFGQHAYYAGLGVA